jgi:hypothetical protein
MSTNSSITRNAKQIQKKSRAHQVTQDAPAGFTVVSGGSGKEYRVILGVVPTCTCDWGQYRKIGSPCGCSHVVAVYNHLSEQAGYKVMAWASQEEAARQHRTRIEVGDGLTLTARKQPAILVNNWPTGVAVSLEMAEVL